MTHRLYRSQADRMLTGVAGGMAEYLRIDPVIVRLLWVLAVVLTSGLGLLVYLALAVITPSLPRQDLDAEGETAGTAAADDETASPERGAPTAAASVPADYAPVRNGAALVVGSALIVIGAVALMSQFGWFDAWRLWPLILIAFGGLLIFNQRR